MEKTIEKTDGNALIQVKVTSNSDEFEVNGVNKWTQRLEIKLCSPARKGKANEELIDEMENVLERKVDIKTGHKSRKKILLVKDASESEVRKKLDIGEEK